MNTKLLARSALKSSGAVVASAVMPQCRYGRSLLLVGHMRSGSTALSNVLCSHPEVSGYGETHVAHRSPHALGQLLINQASRRSWTPRATYLFDKVLHNDLDVDVADDFYRAHLVFLAREPEATVRSIRRLFEALGRGQYATDEEALTYYAQRMSRVLQHLERVAGDDPIVLTHEQVMTDPEATLALLSHRLQLRTPLSNRYTSKQASVKPGAGDPLVSATRSSIGASGSPAEVHPPLQVGARQLREASTLFARYEELACGVVTGGAA